MLRPLPFLFLALGAVVGCTASPSDSLDERTREAFTSGMMQALHPGIRRADTGTQVGALTLKITLDRQSVPISCVATQARAEHRLVLPSNVRTTDFQALARLVEAQCWKNIYPLVPPAMVGEEGKTEIVAPMILVLPEELQNPGTPRRQANAQRDYFWQHLLRDQPVNGIGRVSVYYQANAEGKIEGCLVQLYPHPLRSAEFRLDGELQARLINRCTALNLRDLPGFTANQQGQSTLDYAPWRVGQP